MRSAISSHEMVAGFIKRKMAEASIASHRCPCANGDVAERTDLRSPFAMANWWERNGPLVILRDPFRLGCVVPSCADRWVGLERHFERKAGVDDRAISHAAQAYRRVVVCASFSPADAKTQ